MGSMYKAKQSRTPDSPISPLSDRTTSTSRFTAMSPEGSNICHVEMFCALGNVVDVISWHSTY